MHVLRMFETYDGRDDIMISRGQGLHGHTVTMYKKYGRQATSHLRAQEKESSSNATKKAGNQFPELGNAPGMLFRQTKRATEGARNKKNIVCNLAVV